MRSCGTFPNKSLGTGQLAGASRYIYFLISGDAVGKSPWGGAARASYNGSY
jgi:hypothetical protein